MLPQFSLSRLVIGGTLTGSAIGVIAWCICHWLGGVHFVMFASCWVSELSVLFYLFYELCGIYSGATQDGPPTLGFVTLSPLIFPLLVADLSLSLRLFLRPDLLPAEGTACPSLGPPCLPELWLSGTNRQRITTPLLLSWATVIAVHQSINKLADLPNQWIFQSVRRQGVI